MRYSVAQWIEFRGVRRGLVWQSDDESEEDTDGVLVNDGGRIVWARTPRELTELAEQYGVTLEEDVPSELVKLDGSEKRLIKEVFNRGRIILDARLQERTTAQEQAP